MVDWNDNTKRKRLRLALEDAYPNSVALGMFVDEELGENIAAIAGGDNLTVTAHGLISWGKARNRLDGVFEAFCRENPGNSAISELKQRPLIGNVFSFPEEDLNSLFAMLSSDDSACLQIAFRQAFQAVYSQKFWEIRPDRPSMSSLNEIQDLLANYNANLVVRFVEASIVELQRLDGDRDVTGLQEWRDRIAQHFNISLLESEAADGINHHHVYLLVTLEENGPDLNVYPELHIATTKKPIGFGATPTSCSIDEVADQISKWIHQAEQLLVDDVRDEVEVTLEIFLPCRYLGEDIATTWMVKNNRGEEVKLGAHRWFLVRSTDRIRDLQIQGILRQKWQQLEACENSGNPCNKFHEQKSCPETKGNLRALLKGNAATGLKLLAQLPAAPDRQRTLLYDIIDAAIPIALWTSETDDVDLSILATEFDQILAGSVTNFADLARRWQLRRIESAVSKQIKILCDRPDRIPRLPDLINREDDDAIVA